MNTGILRRQLDEVLLPLATRLPPEPKKSWIATVRKALMMTSAQLAKKVGIDQSTVIRLEQSEMQKTITLESLERMATALGCTLRYVFVPQQSLETLVFE